MDFQTNVLSGITGTLANSGTIRTATDNNTSTIPLPSGKSWSVTSGEIATGTVEYYGSAAQTAVAGTSLVTAEQTETFLPGATGYTNEYRFRVF